MSVVLKQLGNMTQVKKGQYYMHYKPNKLNTEDKECLRLKSVDKHTTHLNFSLQNNTQLPDDPSPVKSLLVFKIPQAPLPFAKFH